jgi:hypothetical protein
MSLRRALLSATLALTLLSTACTLRPRYRDVVVPPGSGQAQAQDGQTVVLRVVDTRTGEPLPGVRVLAQGGRSRLSATSDAQGQFSVAVSSALLQENPLVEVVVPKGVEGYRFEPVSGSAPQAPAPAGSAPSSEPMPAGEAPQAPASETPAPEAPATETPATPPAGGGQDAGM